MEYLFIDSDNNTFPVNGILTPAISRGSFSRSSETYTFEQKIVERSFLSGAAKVGNARLESRMLAFDQKFAFTTDTLFDTFLNTFMLWCEKTVILRDTTNSKQTEVTIIDLTVEYDAGSIKRSGNISAKFTMLNAYWTGISPISILAEALAIGINNIDLTNSGFLKAYPVLTFTVPNPAASLDVYIDETKEGLQLIDPTLGTPTLTELIIDCVKGALTIAGFDRTQNITDRTGYFPIPVGDSTLVVDIPVAASVDIVYYERFYA